MRFFDSHCHFDFANFAQNRQVLWQQCQAQGFSGLLIPGIHPKQWQTLIVLQQQEPHWHIAFGLHPWFLKHYQGAEHLAKTLTKILQTNKASAIGECGLDKTVSFDLATQIEAFEMQLQIAENTQMPAIIHSVKTHNEVLASIKKFNVTGVIHGFTGSYQQAMGFIEQGFYIGVGGSITYPRAKKTREAIRQAPLEYLLLETDAPDMPLSGFQGQDNSPFQLVNVAKHLAELKNLPLDVVTKQCFTNSQTLFHHD